MTVGTQVHQALASLRSLEGQFATFALDTDDQQAKQMYKQCRQQLAQVTRQLTDHVSSGEHEKPTYQTSTCSACGEESGGEFSSLVETSGIGGIVSMTGMTGMDNMSNLSGFGSNRSTGSTASTGSTGTHGLSSPNSTTEKNKPTKKKSR